MIFFNEEKIIKEVLGQYKLETFGIHGVCHWARVLENGIKIAEQNGANIKIVRLFAILHDSKRENDSLNFQHGFKAAEYAKTLNGTFFDLTNSEFDMLYYACEKHTDGLTKAEKTIETCWDADRLDLARANIIPNKKFLCTKESKQNDIINWATKRSIDRFVPNLVYDTWKIKQI